jgi:hypothetical protein
MDNNVAQPSQPPFRYVRFSAAILCFALLLVCYQCAPYLRSLPSDEEMINNFHYYRQDFERLAKIYREDLSVPINRTGGLEPTKDVRSIMDRIGVSAICGDQVIWIGPDPYLNWSRSKEMESYVPLYGQERRQFSGVIMYFAHGEVTNIQYGVNVCKRYYYIPVVPRIIEGKLFVPADLLAGISFVAPTLNTCPSIFEGNFDCAVRQIEPRWFIQVCR